MASRIFLIGFMGSGKTTLGLKLARRIKYEFIDMDRLIEETAGMTIPGIFNELGEQVFRKWEQDILQELCTREKVVVSTGGGAPCHDQMIGTMNAYGMTVYLKLSPAILKDRLKQSKTERPLIRGKTDTELLDFITGLLKEREPYYGQAYLVVESLDPDIDQLARMVSEHG